jgi:cell division protein FtsB
MVAILSDVNDFRKRRNMKKEIPRMLLGVAGIVALAGLTFVAARAAWDMYGKFAAASEARSDAETQLAQLQTQYERVEAQVAELTTDRGIEAAVRERYGVARPGEGEIDIVRHASTSDSGARGSESWFRKLWNSLFVW